MIPVLEPAAPLAPEAALTPLERELRAEIDRLRLENQRLRGELEDLREPRDLLVRGLRGASAALRARARDLRRGKPRAELAAAADFHPDYRPYPVRPLHPVEAERPRVLHVIANFYLGGSSRLVVDLVEHLGHRYEQEVVTRDIPDVPAYTGLPVHHHPELHHERQALAVLDAFRPALVHVHFLGHHRTAYSEMDWRWYRRFFQAAERRGVPVVENVNIPVEPYVSSSVRSYVYVSETVRRRFGTLDGGGVVVYPGSDLARFSRGGTPVPDDTAGMVYRLEGDKLDPGAIEVFVELVRRRPGTRVLIVGGGRFLETYRRRVAEAGAADAFTFTGYVAYDELPEHYRRMSVFVAPVHRESFGQVSPFAMGMGIPVVGYDVGAIREIVGDEELLAAPGDAARLAEIVAGLLDDRERRERIGAANRRRAEERFSVEAMAAAYDALFRGILEG